MLCCLGVSEETSKKGISSSEIAVILACKLSINELIVFSSIINSVFVTRKIVVPTDYSVIPSVLIVRGII